MVKIKLLTISFIGIAIIAALLSFYFAPSAEGLGTTLATWISFATFSLGAAVLFSLGLSRNFTHAFRRSYRLVAGGLIALCLPNIANVLFLFNAPEAPHLVALFGEGFLTLGVLLVYSGLYRFARLLQVQTLLTNLPLIISILLVGIIILWISPHGEVTTELVFDIGRAFFVTEMVVYGLWALLAWRIARVASPVYAASLGWLGAGGAIISVTTAVSLSFDFVTYPEWLPLNLLSILVIAAYFCFLMAGAAFNKVALAPMLTRPQSQGDSLIDSIVYLASLASKPREIDPVLDRCRAITAARKSNEPLTPQQKTTLQEVQEEIKKYLVTKERVRTFQAHQLEDLLQERFTIKT